MRLPARSDGFSLVELMLSTLIMMVVAGVVFALVAPSQWTFAMQPEVQDLQQRVRVAADTLHRELLGAGAGVRTGASPGPLHNALAPILPYRFPHTSGDDRTPRMDAISLLSAAGEPAQARVIAVSVASSPASVQVEPNCGGAIQDDVCGFTAGLPVVLFDTTGRSTTGTVVDVDGHFVLIDAADAAAVSPGAGAVLVGVVMHHYWLEPARGAEPPRLMHYDGRRTTLPVVDHVVALRFEYFGDPRPPTLLPGTDVARPAGPWTTYGPRPPPIGRDDARDEWPPGENCVFAAGSGSHVPRLPALAPGTTDVAIAVAAFGDGPWCPDAGDPRRYDADLLRVRRIRVQLTVEAADAGVRGPRGLLFVRGGTAVRGQLPDHRVEFDVRPRNMGFVEDGAR